MAFENREFTEQERKEITGRKIKNKFFFLETQYIEYPFWGTIEEERRVYLLCTGSHREEQGICFLLITDEWTAYFVMFRQLQKPDVIVWSIVNMKISSENNVSEAEVLKLLKESLTEYRWNGFAKDINGYADVKFEF